MSRWVARLDLLAGETVLRTGDRDQPETPRPQHDRYVDDHRLRRLVGVTCVAEPRGRLGATGLGIGVARRGRTAQIGDELGEGLAGALDERRTLGLAVVGEHDDLVRPRRRSGRPLDPAELAVEVAQHRQRVDAFRTGVVSDLVVAQHVDVDGGPSLPHVVHDALHRHVAGDHRRERAQQRVRPIPLDARLDLPPPLSGGRHPFARDLHDRGEHGSDRLAGPREVAEVAGSGPTFLATSGTTHREHGPLRVAREQVGVARTVVGEQPIAVGMGEFDRRCKLGVVRHDDRAGRLVEPAEGGHVERSSRAGSRLG